MRRSISISRKIRGLGCVTRALARARFTKPVPHIFLHYCTQYTHNKPPPLCVCLFLGSPEQENGDGRPERDPGAVRGVAGRRGVGGGRSAGGTRGQMGKR